jgi:hypothetical protein
MNFAHNLSKYLHSYAVDQHWPLIAKNLEDIDQVIVIPAYEEFHALFSTLASLSRNPANELERTLVLCIINNRAIDMTTPEVFEDNQRTISCLKNIVEKRIYREKTSPPSFTASIDEIMQGSLRIGYIDASSEGLELPARNGGVGFARKIGHDKALRIIDFQKPTLKLLFSLDADTIVEKHYLSAVRRYFEKEKSHAAVVSYEHQQANNHRIQEAICCYEIFLRYYILGLRYAESPYAFHSIGSTIICTPEAYTTVRGMNRREAGEDFYFLNKLAKIKSIGYIGSTKVYPAARISDRTSFGTGQRIIRFLEGKKNGHLLYDPEVFIILKRWFKEVQNLLNDEPQKIRIYAKSIHPLISSFLEIYHFDEKWGRIRNNSKDLSYLKRHFHIWFDGFKTLKFIHYLTGNDFPLVGMFEAVEGLLHALQIDFPMEINHLSKHDIKTHMQLLQFLRDDCKI